MKSIALFALATALAVTLAGIGTAQAPVKNSTLQGKCPVMGNPIDKKVFADHDGKRVYFCCPMCIDKFKKDPEGYIKKMEARGVTFEKAPLSQSRCPVKGTPVNKKVYTDYRGKRVYFCCPGCIDKFKKDPEGYIKRMEAQGVTFEKSARAQTRCPVMGTPVNKKVYTDYRGQRIYFCCKDCVPKFLKNPAKYLRKMEQQGIVPADVPGAKKGMKGPRRMQGAKSGECGGSSCGAGAKKGKAECPSGKCSGEQKKAGCSGGGCGGK